MAKRTIVIYGHPVLRQRAKEVGEYDDSLRLLVADLFETMAAYQGVGLAANQVGVPQRVFVIDAPREDGTHDRFAVVNPVVSERTDGEAESRYLQSFGGDRFHRHEQYHAAWLRRRSDVSRRAESGDELP